MEFSSGLVFTSWLVRICAVPVTLVRQNRRPAKAQCQRLHFLLELLLTVDVVGCPQQRATETSHQHPVPQEDVPVAVGVAVLSSWLIPPASQARKESGPFGFAPKLGYQKRGLLVASPYTPTGAPLNNHASTKETTRALSEPVAPDLGTESKEH